MDKRMFKKDKEELREWLQFKRRGSIVQAKKGKGAYRRKPKYSSFSLD